MGERCKHMGMVKRNGTHFMCSGCRTDLALVDALRALGEERAREVLARIERDVGPEGIASLRYAPEFWLRQAQMVRPPYAAIEVFAGERGAGKSHAARVLFEHLLPTSKFPRIVVPTDGAAVKTVFAGPSGFREWTDPLVRCRFVQSAGYAGDIELGPHTITVTSAAAPVSAIGPGYGLTWADDIAAWIEAVGAEQAAKAWQHVLKSNRERPGIMIVATTGRGVEFLWRLLSAEEQSGVRIHDLGVVENNAGNLTRNYLEKIVPGLRAAGDWDEEQKTGAFSHIDWSKHRVREAPVLERVVVFIDPAKSQRSHACKVGIVGVGIDARSTIYGLANRSAQRPPDGPEGWPAAAHDLAEELERRYGVTVELGIECNTLGKAGPELLRAEEKNRKAARGKPAQATRKIHEVTSRPRDPKTRRAAPIVALCEGNQVRMLPNLGELEASLSGLTDAGAKADDADAFVHGARELAGLSEEGEEKLSAREAFEGLAAANARMPAPGFGAIREAPRTSGDDWQAENWDRA